jgi:iron-sulfur cluster insertion protein
MFSIELTSEALDKLRNMLRDNDSCVRLREFKVGCSCSAKIELNLGLDEMNEDEDEKLMLGDVPFIAEKDFLEKYGTQFQITMNETGDFALAVRKD